MWYCSLRVIIDLPLYNNAYWWTVQCKSWHSEVKFSVFNTSAWSGSDSLLSSVRDWFPVAHEGVQNKIPDLVNMFPL